MFKLNGKPLRAGEFGKSLMKAVVENVGEQMRNRIESIRHPRSGEFPTVVVEGDSLESLSMRIEGSPELLAIVRERLSPEEQAGIEFQEREWVPHAFFSYAREDLAIAEPIVNALQAAGIDTWF